MDYMRTKMHKYILICFFLFPLLVITAQPVLAQKLAVADTNRVNTLLQLGIDQVNKSGEFQKDLDSALRYLNEAEQLSVKIKFRKGQLNALTYKGKAYLEARDLAKAKPFFLRVINFYHNQGDLLNEALACNEFADDMYTEDEIYNDERIPYYKRAAALFDQTNHKLKMLLALKDLADIHLDQGKYDLAKSELIFVAGELKILKYPKIYQTYHLLAVLFSRLTDTKNELFYRIAAVKSMEDDPKPSNPGKYYYNLSITYSNMHRFDVAIYYGKKSLEVAKRSEDNNAYYKCTAAIVIYLGGLYKFKEALIFLDNAERQLPPQNDDQKRTIVDM
nr:hypothetical protein [Mucilaginibacter sp. L294]